jgi:hypothetical protein
MGSDTGRAYYIEDGRSKIEDGSKIDGSEMDGSTFRIRPSIFDLPFSIFDVPSGP